MSLSGLTDTKVNTIFKEVFKDIQAGLPDVGNILTRYAADFNEAVVFYNRQSTTAAMKEMAGDMIALKRQLTILNTFKQLRKVTHVSKYIYFKGNSV